MPKSRMSHFGDQVIERWRFIICPTSGTRLAWDCLTAFVLMYDILTFPLASCFDFNNRSIAKVNGFLTGAFWTADIFEQYVPEPVEPEKIISNATGWLSPNESHTWLDDWRALQGEQTLPYLYLVAFLWTATQFTPAKAPQIQPVNSYERIFHAMTLLLGLGITSSTIGSLSALITQSRLQMHDQTVQKERLRRFLQDNSVSHNLGRCIMHYINFKDRFHRQLSEEGVALLKDLPWYLRRDLRYEMRSELMCTMPLFFMIDQVQEIALKNICDLCLADRIITMDTLAFYEGTESAGMYLVTDGEFTYASCAGATDQDLEAEMQKVSVREALSEMTLWCRWSHRGQLQATTNALVFIVSPESFANVVRTHLLALKCCCLYAAIFQEKMQRAADEDNTYIDDLFHAFENQEEVMQAVVQEDEVAPS